MGGRRDAWIGLLLLTIVGVVVAPVLVPAREGRGNSSPYRTALREQESVLLAEAKSAEIRSDMVLAESKLTAALEVSGGDLSRHKDLAEFYERWGRENKSYDHWKVIAGIGPKNPNFKHEHLIIQDGPQLYVKCADLAHKLGRQEEELMLLKAGFARTKATYNGVVPVLEPDGSANSMRQALLQILGQRVSRQTGDEKALPIFERAANLDPSNGNAWFLAARKAMDLGRKEKALTYFSQSKNASRKSEGLLAMIDEQVRDMNHRPRTRRD